MSDALGLDRPAEEDEDAVLWLSVAGEDFAALSDELGPDDRYLVGFLDMNLVTLARCSLGKVPGKNNWVEQEGGLPQYICRVARSIHRKRGLSISRSIAIAVGVMKNWASGRGDVDADTRAKAAKAIAQWEKMKASAKARPNKGD